MIKKITYNDQTLETKFYSEVSEVEQEIIKNLYYQKPSIEDVTRNIITLNKGGVMKTKINEYYFKELYSKVKLNHSKWSIEDVLNSKDLLGFVKGKIKSNSIVYPLENELIKNVETVFRIGSKGIAQKPSLFPMKVINELLERYNVKNYHDYSCGWGDRLTGAMIADVNYFGTDVNYELVKSLKEYKKHWEAVTEKNNIVDIRCLGSENYIDEWENRMDFSFSSPPYFDLEDYKLGKQSWSNGTTIEEWSENYLNPTIKNCYKYLKKDGIFAININNTRKHDLKSLAYEISIKEGFKYVESFELKNIKRIKSNAELFNNSEEIMIFSKEEME